MFVESRGKACLKKTAEGLEDKWRTGDLDKSYTN